MYPVLIMLISANDVVNRSVLVVVDGNDVGNTHSISLTSTYSYTNTSIQNGSKEHPIFVRAAPPQPGT